MVIPFNWPYVPPSAIEVIQRSLGSRRLSGDGPQSDLATVLLERIAGPGHYLLTPSCTNALELAFRLIDLRPGDEVIMPSFNFTSSAIAVALCGATPVFVDVDLQTANINVEQAQRAFTPRTRAIVALHYAGLAADIAPLSRLAADHGLCLIEDAAHGLGVQTAAGDIGSWGAMSTYSFHETKNIQCGEGGALRINDASLIDRAEVMREKGTNRRAFFRGQVDKYSWVDLGSSWLLSDLSAALLVASLTHFQPIQEQRVRVWNGYLQGIPDAFWARGFCPPTVPSTQQNAAHMFQFRSENGRRDELLAFLQGQGVGATFHYQPLHDSTAGRRYGRSLSCTNSSRVAEGIVRLPLFPEMSESSLSYVIESLSDFR